MAPGIGNMVVGLGIVGALLLLCAATAQAADDLPGAVASGVQRIHAALDQVDKALELDRLTTAQRKAQEAEKTLAEIEKRYGGKFSPDHPDYRAMRERLAATLAKVEAATAAAAEGAAGAAAAKEANEALCREWVAKLGPFVDRNSDRYLRVGAELNAASPEEQAQSRAAYQEAKRLLVAYQQVAFPLGKSMALQNVESTLTSTMRYYAHDEASDAQEAACREWVERLAPYVEVGLRSDRYLVASATANPEEIKARKALYEQAKAQFEAYRQAELPLGKTPRLQQVEADLQRVLAAFPAALAASEAMVSGSVGDRLDGMLGYLGRDPSWRSDPAQKPPTVMERDLQPLREELERLAAAGAVPADELGRLREKLAAVDAANAEHRRIRAERTWQLPDRFAGPELETLRTKAAQVAQATHAGARVLRVTVPSAAWAVEDVVEATDTTHTAVRRRVTRSVRAQVALKAADGSVWLQEVYLGQDRQEGGWSALQGHTTWADAMAEANVGRDGP